jgi:hypothetical protein
MYLFVNELEMMVKCDVKGENDKGGCIGYYMFLGSSWGLRVHISCLFSISY